MLCCPDQANVLSRMTSLENAVRHVGEDKGVHHLAQLSVLQPSNHQRPVLPNASDHPVRFVTMGLWSGDNERLRTDIPALHPLVFRHDLIDIT